LEWSKGSGSYVYNYFVKRYVLYGRPILIRVCVVSASGRTCVRMKCGVLCSSRSIIRMIQVKEAEMSEACLTYGEKRNCV
jgi:hypothetical protein